jgi:hypothetical protein
MDAGLRGITEMEKQLVEVDRTVDGVGIDTVLVE